MSDPTKPSPDPQSFADFTLIGLRIAAAGYALYFAIGQLLWWMGLLRMQAEYKDGSALIFPWIFLPLFASAGLAAGFAIGGVKRPDLIGVCGQVAMAIQGVYGICAIALDLATNRYPEYSMATKFLAVSLLGLVVASALRHASIGYANPWPPVVSMILSVIPSLLAVVIGSMAIEGWISVWHNKLDGWAAFTTPVTVVASAIGTAATIALVRSSWQLQSGQLPSWAARILPARWNLDRAN